MVKKTLYMSIVDLIILSFFNLHRVALETKSTPF